MGSLPRSPSLAKNSDLGGGGPAGRRGEGDRPGSPTRGPRRQVMRFLGAAPRGRHDPRTRCDGYFPDMLRRRSDDASAWVGVLLAPGSVSYGLAGTVYLVARDRTAAPVESR